MTASKQTPLSVSMSLTPSNKPGKTLGVNVRSQECNAGWRLPSIRYAVSRVEIEFDLVNCIAPEEDWNNDTVNLFDGNVDNQIESSVAIGNTSETGWIAASTASTITANASKKSGKTRQKATSSEKRFSTKHSPLLAHGNSKNPKWTLTSEQVLQPLLGTLIKSSHFCRLEPTGANPSVRIRYKIPYDALLFRKADGSFSSTTKFGVVRLLLRAALCEKDNILLDEKVE